MLLKERASYSLWVEQGKGVVLPLSAVIVRPGPGQCSSSSGLSPGSSWLYLHPGCTCHSPGWAALQTHGFRIPEGGTRPCTILKMSLDCSLRAADIDREAQAQGKMSHVWVDTRITSLPFLCVLSSLSLYFLNCKNGAKFQHYYSSRV